MSGARILGLVALSAYLAAATLPCPSGAVEKGALSPVPSFSAGHSHGPGAGHDAPPPPPEAVLTAPCFCGCGEAPAAASVRTRLGATLPPSPPAALVLALPIHEAHLDLRGWQEPLHAPDPIPV